MSEKYKTKNQRAERRQEYGLYKRNYGNRTCLFLQQVLLSQLAGMLGWSAGDMGRKHEDSSFVCLGSISDPSFLNPNGKDGDLAKWDFVARHSEPGAEAEQG